MINKYGMPEQEYQTILAASAQDVKVKRGPGRPPGLRIPIKPPADLLHPHTVRLTDAEWDACQITGDASGFIRQAIKERRRRLKGLNTVEPGI